MDLNKKPIYPIEPWTITETEFLIENNYRNETTFALSNGYIGTRGTFEEAYPFDIDTGLEGNFINGFYESEEIRYGEANFGSPLKSQSLLNLPNLKETKLYLEDEVFDLRTGTVEAYQRQLRMKDGILTRSLIWTSPAGKKVKLEMERFVSFQHKNIMAARYTVTPLNFEGNITFVSKLQANVENHTRKTNPIVDYGPFGRKLDPVKLYAKDGMTGVLGGIFYEGTTQNSGLTMACGSSHQISRAFRQAADEESRETLEHGWCEGGIEVSGNAACEGGVEVTQNAACAGGAEATQNAACKETTEVTWNVACGRITDASQGVTCENITEEFSAECRFTLRVSQGEKCTLDKFICYTSDLDQEKAELEEFVEKELKRAEQEGYDALRRTQLDYMHRYWQTADVKIQGNDALWQGIHFNLFHIMQAAGRDGHTGMGAKGLSGEGYEGHYFWDTEMYVMPLLIYTEPKTARALLEYRYHTLDQARARARVLGHDKGALYPWRTINGEEASTYYPLGTAQYHINADIEYALSLYLQVTQDKEFFEQMGAEMLIETARVWADVGSFAECKGGKYCICDVTGPDEYNVLVDNNFYTNLMAREHLRDAIKAVEYLLEEDKIHHSGGQTELNKQVEVDLQSDYRESHHKQVDAQQLSCLARLSEKLDFDIKEIDLWKQIVEQMYFPFDEKRQVYPMDDGFMMRKPWDENKIPPEKRAWLYENYHPLFIMRHRMSKQADAILGMYLHSHYFTKEELKRNYDFYQEVTLHHSSLSTCIFGIVASSIGYEAEAYEYFEQSARMDLDDYHNNFYAGIHAANMAGAWQAIVNGFAGLRCYENQMHFAPYLPKEWEGYEFQLQFQQSVLQITVQPEKAEFKLIKGTKLQFFVHEKEVLLDTEHAEFTEQIETVR